MRFSSRVFNSLVAIPLLMYVNAVTAYQEIEVANGGSIVGRVIYQGHVPTKKIIPTKDKEVCGGIRDVPRIYIGSNNGVQDAVVFLKKVSKGKAWGKPPETPQINNIDCRFEPHIQVMRPGDIDILNSDPVLHNTHGFYGRRTAFNLALPNKGDLVRKKLKRPGEVRVECDAHGWMLAWVYVAESPYYTLVNENGEFTISDIPAGKYTLVAKQEYTGATETSVTVKEKEEVRITIELKK